MFSHKTTEFQLIANYLGHGDVKNGLWFIGVEPGGGGWKDNDQTRENFKNECSHPVYTYTDKNERPDDVHLWPVANGPAKIAARLSEKNIDWRTYRDEHLWLTGSAIFNGNILPVSKKSLKEWPPSYKSLLGYDHQEYINDFEKITEFRQKKFSELRERNTPQAIICFGKSHWNAYKKFFVTDGAQPAKNISSTEVYDDDRVILTRHFSTGMSDSILESIATQLHQWGVKLP